MADAINDSNSNNYCIFYYFHTKNTFLFLYLLKMKTLTVKFLCFKIKL